MVFFGRPGVTLLTVFGTLVDAIVDAGSKVDVLVGSVASCSRLCSRCGLNYVVNMQLLHMSPKPSFMLVVLLTVITLKFFHDLSRCSHLV